MLLSQKTNALEHLAGTRTRRLDADSEVGVLPLEFVDSLRADARRARRCVDSLHAGLSLESAPAESRELVAKVPDEPLKLLEWVVIRTFAV